MHSIVHFTWFGSQRTGPTRLLPGLAGANLIFQWNKIGNQVVGHYETSKGEDSDNEFRHVFQKGLVGITLQLGKSMIRK
jgi:hypothetical protein